MRTRLPIAVILAAAAAALCGQAWHLSLTADEPSHFAAGLAWWTGNDHLPPSDTPPLTRILAGWVPRVWGARPIPQSGSTSPRNAYEAGVNITRAEEAGPARRLIFWSRAPFIVFTLALVFLVWWWAHELWGGTVATILALCAAAEPTIAGHGALIKSDVPAALMALLFAWTAWRYWLVPARVRFAWMLAALTLAALTKFTLITLVPVAMLIAVVRGRRWWAPFAIAACLYGAILASYQFDASRLSRSEANEFARFGLGLENVYADAAVALIPLPDQFVKGIMFIGNADRSTGFGTYMLGRLGQDYSPWYFPLCWAIKFPIALQLLSLFGLVAAAKRLSVNAVFIWGFAALFTVAALRSHIQIGFRHLLPAIPFYILGAGFAVDALLKHRRARWMLPPLAAWLLAAAIWIYPNGISYFNEWIGGPRNGSRYLADSNLDWGQNFRDLQRYVDRERVPMIHVGLFGLDAVEHYVPFGRFDFTPQPEPGRLWIPEPGTYAMSVNILLGFAEDENVRGFYDWFRNREPDARAGWSILIYKVDRK